jgi:hypothetical protein
MKTLIQNNPNLLGNVILITFFAIMLIIALSIRMSNGLITM